MDYVQRGKSPVYSPIKQYPVLAQKCNQWDGITLEKALFLDPTTIIKYTEDRFLRNGDIVINSTGTGTLGRIGIFFDTILQGYSCLVADSHITVLRSNSLIDPKYIFYFFRSMYQQEIIVDKSAGCTNQQELYIDTIRTFLIPLPPRQEQKYIINAIESAFAIVIYLEQEKLSLAKIAMQAKSKILDLAVRGKLVPQDPNDEPASVLLERIRAEKAVSDKGKKGRVSSDKYHYQRVVSDEQELFDLPDSWYWCRLGDIVSIIGGVSYDKRDISNEGIRILRGGNIQNGIVIFADDDVFLPSKYTNSENTIYKDDIIIVASTGSETVIGKAGFIHKDFHNVQIGAFLRIIRPKFSWLSGYLNLIFKSKFYTKYIRNKAKGTNINNIKTNYLTDFFIPLPPIAEQNRIDKIVNRLLDKITYMSEQ
jgi:type I restriction enzyme S subunit